MEDFGKKYYERCKNKGIDYAYYGNWQKQYAKLVVFMTELYKIDYRKKAMLDIGCACGVNLLAFKETQIFTEHFGIDVSEYLIELGKEKFDFKNDELIVADCQELPFEDQSMDFVHCSQLFEHIEIKKTRRTIDEIYRVLKKGNKAFITLNAIKRGQNKDDVFKQDPSHIVARMEKWWHDFFSRKFRVYENTEEKWIKGKFYPGGMDDIDPNKKGKNKRRTFYDHYKDDWSTFILIKD
jgi:ubiquinone/menaquinone biosynthesis C-methylase UbiE